MFQVERFGKIFMIVPFGVMSVLAAILTILFLPETMGKHLPETIQEVTPFLIFFFREKELSDRGWSEIEEGQWGWKSGTGNAAVEWEVRRLTKINLNIIHFFVYSQVSFCSNFLFF